MDKNEIKFERRLAKCLLRDLYVGAEMPKAKCPSYSKFILKKGVVFEGEAIDNLPQGRGKQTFRNGATYQGYFEDGLFHGYGIYRTKNSKEKTGYYYKGRYVNTFERFQCAKIHDEYTVKHSKEVDKVGKLAAVYGCHEWRYLGNKLGYNVYYIFRLSNVVDSTTLTNRKSLLILANEEEVRLASIEETRRILP